MPKSIALFFDGGCGKGSWTYCDDAAEALTELREEFEVEDASFIELMMLLQKPAGFEGVYKGVRYKIDGEEVVSMWDEPEQKKLREIVAAIRARTFQQDFKRSASARSTNSRYFAISFDAGLWKIETFLSRAAARKHYKVSNDSIKKWAAKNEDPKNPKFFLGGKSKAFWFREPPNPAALVLAKGEIARVVALTSDPTSARVWVTNMGRYKQREKDAWVSIQPETQYKRIKVGEKYIMIHHCVALAFKDEAKVTQDVRPAFIACKCIQDVQAAVKAKTFDIDHLAHGSALTHWLESLQIISRSAHAKKTGSLTKSKAKPKTNSILMVPERKGLKAEAEAAEGGGWNAHECARRVWGAAVVGENATPKQLFGSKKLETIGNSLSTKAREADKRGETTFTYVPKAEGCSEVKFTIVRGRMVVAEKDIERGKFKGYEWEVCGAKGLVKIATGWTKGSVDQVNGRHYIQLPNSGKIILAHPIIAAVFHPREYAAAAATAAAEGKVLLVRHLNGDHTDNRACNLKWSVGGSENNQDRYEHARARDAAAGVQQRVVSFYPYCMGVV